MESLGTWISAEDLRLGDELLTATGRTPDVDGLIHYTLTSQTVYNLTVEGLHTFYVLAGDHAVLVHNSGSGPSVPGKGDCGNGDDDAPSGVWGNYQTQSGQLFDENLQDLPGGEAACTVCAAKAGLNPALRGQPRSIIYFPERGHAVLAVGDDIDNMIIIDESILARKYGTNIPLSEYSKTMGRYEPYGLDETRKAISDAISGSSGFDNY